MTRRAQVREIPLDRHYDTPKLLEARSGRGAAGAKLVEVTRAAGAAGPGIAPERKRKICNHVFPTKEVGEGRGRGLSRA